MYNGDISSKKNGDDEESAFLDSIPLNQFAQGESDWDLDRDLDLDPGISHFLGNIPDEIVQKEKKTKSKASSAVSNKLAKKGPKEMQQSTNGQGIFIQQSGTKNVVNSVKEHENIPISSFCSIVKEKETLDGLKTAFGENQSDGNDDDVDSDDVEANIDPTKRKKTGENMFATTSKNSAKGSKIKTKCFDFQ